MPRPVLNRVAESGADAPGDAVQPAVDITIVMPCLNESQSLTPCIMNAREALAELEQTLDLTGEILIADNGSTDGSQQLAASLGARVVNVPERGYGAALIDGCRAAHGRFLLMGDADGSYDFTDGVEMVRKLHAGADFCIGSRFRGGIAPGAMPWKNRYIGNPALTGILNLFFNAGVEDAHCGLRAISKPAFEKLNLSGTGMEFASEMVIKASLKKLRTEQAPAKLRPDLRDREPHLRPWRDGWRHLRYLFMLSPTWAFGVPGVAAMTASACIFAVALLHYFGILPGNTPFGESWTIAAGFLAINGHLAVLMAIASHLYGVRNGYRILKPWMRGLASMLTLETMLLVGGALILLSLIGYGFIARYWSLSGYVALPSTLPLVLSALAGATGVQTVFGGFLLSVVTGNNAAFFSKESASGK